MLTPSPREISVELMTRHEFKPATSINVLAAAWIQFEVHDWLNHGRGAEKHPFEIPLAPGDKWFEDTAVPPGSPMLIPRTEPDPSPSDPNDPPAFTTKDTFWWDGSQIYGTDPEFAAAIRTGKHGKLAIDRYGLITDEAWEIFERQEVARNFWLGLGMLHSLFMMEHNSVCEKLHEAYPEMGDDKLYHTARLVVSALMAKIHTVEWTPAVIAHPTTVKGITSEWWGLFGETFARMIGRRTGIELFGGIPGTRTDTLGVPFSLTEEFVAVYRMHPLIPDDFDFSAPWDPAPALHYTLPDLGANHFRARTREIGLGNAFYSFGTANPGEITLNNYPKHLQDLRRPRNGDSAGPPSPDERLDLAAVDILRSRERGVPRYNEFRRLFHLESVDFEDLSPENPNIAQTLRDLYHDDIEAVDLMVGLYAEGRPTGFAFSDTAFRVFLLMAYRRIKSDRFLTESYKPNVYTEVGLNWVESNTMRTVLMRHFGELKLLDGVKNPFAPWDAATNRSD